MTTVTQGTKGLSAAIYYFASTEATVCVPLSDNQSYDLIVDLERSLKRVEVKCTNSLGKTGHYVVQLKSIRPNRTANKIVPFDNSKIELLFILTGNNRMFLIPTEKLKATSAVTLNVEYDKYEVWPKA